MSSAKPQAVPIGLSRISAVEGSIACFLLFSDMTRLRRRKKSSMRCSQSSLRTSSTPAARAAISCDRSSTVGPRPPLTMTASARSRRQPKRREQFLAVVADGCPPAHRQPEILELLAHIAEVRVDDLAGQDFVAGANDLDAHAFLSLYLGLVHPRESGRSRATDGVLEPWIPAFAGMTDYCCRFENYFPRYQSNARLMRAQSSSARSSPGAMAITSWLQPASRNASTRCLSACSVAVKVVRRINSAVRICAPRV